MTQRHEQPVADERQSENIAESALEDCLIRVACMVRISGGYLRTLPQ
jgi:hypothetical protein